jgi:hypothetical protein
MTTQNGRRHAATHCRLEVVLAHTRERVVHGGLLVDQVLPGLAVAAR